MKCKKFLVAATMRRRLLDQRLNNAEFCGRVLDIGGKKTGKRGTFVPPSSCRETWEYLNVDDATNPDYCTSAECIPVEDKTFDTVVMTEVLEHLENPGQVLREAVRVVKNGGKVIATIPFLYAVHADPADYQRWTPEKIRMEFAKAGLEVMCVEPMGGVFSVIYDLLYITLGRATENAGTLKNRLLRKLILSWFAGIFLKLDEVYSYTSTCMTTGYYIEAQRRQ